MGCVGSTCCHGNGDYEHINHHNMANQPMMYMCVSSKDSIKFADVGDEIVLFINFGDSCSPCKLQKERIENTSVFQRVRDTVDFATGSVPHDAEEIARHEPERSTEFEVKIANHVTNLIKLHPYKENSRVYKAKFCIPPGQANGLTDGAPIPVLLPYKINEHGQEMYREIKENSIDQNYTVYFQSLWNQLKEHCIQSYNVTSHTGVMQRPGRYGSMAGRDGVDAGDGGLDSVERHERQYGAQYQKPKRLWPDTWGMKCWNGICEPILRPNNAVTRFIAMFFVAPLVNVTTLSLYYQLFLTEVFHTRFWTRLGHYLSMPLIVLMMLIFFAQFRFVFDNDVTNCYKNNNFEVLILNGSLLLAIIFFLWYLLWGVVQKTCLMGIFMILPLTILVILANIYFQLAIKNSYNHKSLDCNVCWNHTIYGYKGVVHFYNIFDHGMEWYYNPLVWAGVLSFFQAMSHIFEPKLPPRVSQTAHWLSISDIMKQNGCSKTLCILMAQAVFGTVDEFLASARLLPIFVLRVCYELGYNQEEWKRMKKISKYCIDYGDPAIDFIGIGGAEHPSTSSWSNSIVFNNKVSIDQLKQEVQSMKHALTPQQKKVLTEPALLHLYKNNNHDDPFLQHYVTLRHHVAQYQLQVSAYGPFRTNGQEQEASIDNDRMKKDFGDNPTFMNFLSQVRFGLWKMEDDILNKRHLCCEPPTEEV